MSNATKKVIVRSPAGDLLHGYLSVGGFVLPGEPPRFELLDLSGRVTPLLLRDVRMISYVRDFNLADIVLPERLGRRTFLARPRGEGLWIRATFRDGEQLEGLAASNFSFLTTAVDDQGISMTPPDVRSNTQRIFIPRSALAELQLLAVITSPSRQKAAAPSTDLELQKNLF